VDRTEDVNSAISSMPWSLINKVTFGLHDTCHFSDLHVGVHSHAIYDHIYHLAAVIRLGDNETRVVLVVAEGGGVSQTM